MVAEVCEREEIIRNLIEKDKDMRVKGREEEEEERICTTRGRTGENEEY